MNEDIEKILRTIKYCAGDYMKQEEGVQCFEWSDLWVLNEYIKQLQNNWNELKKYISAEWYCFDNESVEFEVARKIMKKAQELEQGKDE